MPIRNVPLMADVIISRVLRSVTRLLVVSDRIVIWAFVRAPAWFLVAERDVSKISNF